MYEKVGIQAKNIRVKAWLSAMRLRTLPLALASVLTGAAVARDADKGSSLVLGLIVSTTLLLQILSNLANDYGDSAHGTDNAHRVGPQRAVQSGAISLQSMKTAVMATALLAFCSGSALLYVGLVANGRKAEALGFLVLGLLAIAAAVKYTAGKNPYGYQGLGDAAVMLFFGWIGVGGSAFLLGTPLSPGLLLPATAVGALATAVLNLNNLRDHANDAASGKHTLVVKMGFAKAKVYHLALFTLAWLCFLGWMLGTPASPWRWLAAGFVILHALHLIKVLKTTDPALLDPELKKIALSSLAMALILLATSG